MKKSLLIIINIVTLLFSQNEVCFDIETNPNPNNSALGCFTKYINVLDCIDIYADPSVQDNIVLHAASIAAELLDNNEDGIVDDPLLFQRLQ